MAQPAMAEHGRNPFRDMVGTSVLTLTSKWRRVNFFEIIHLLLIFTMPRVTHFSPCSNCVSNSQATTNSPICLFSLSLFLTTRTPVHLHTHLRLPRQLSSLHSQRRTIGHVQDGGQHLTGSGIWCVFEGVNILECLHAPHCSLCSLLVWPSCMLLDPSFTFAPCLFRHHLPLFPACSVTVPPQSFLTCVPF